MLQNASPEYPKEISEEYLRVTPAAEAQLAKIMQGADEEFTALRVFVEGGGCGGLTYGMTYAEAPTELDSVLHHDSFRLVLDTVALNFLRGAEIDYVVEDLKEFFVFNNVFQSVGGSGMCAGCGGSGF